MWNRVKPVEVSCYSGVSGSLIPSNIRDMSLKRNEHNNAAVKAFYLLSPSVFHLCPPTIPPCFIIGLHKLSKHR